MGAKRGRIQSIERAAAILRLLSGPSRRRGVVELADELELSKSTVHGLLRTLKDVGFVEQNFESGKYQLGPALLHMGSSYLDGNELRTRALNWADALAIQSGESVQIGMLHERRVLIVHDVFRPDDTPQQLSVGSLMPAHATALGKALLAHYGHAARHLNGEVLPRYTTATITDTGRLQTELDAASERGWASEIGELLQDVASIAAPIEDGRRMTVGAIGISGAIARLCTTGSPHAELVGYVIKTARSISQQLGAAPW